MMGYHFSFYSYLALLAALVGLWAAWLIWSKRRTIASVYLAALEVMAALWAVTAALEAAASGLAPKLFWSKISYFGIVSVPVFFLLFALEYGHPLRVYTPPSLSRGFAGIDFKRWRSHINILLLWFIPAITLFLVFTNEYHYLHWSSVTYDVQSNRAVYGHQTVWFWVFTVYDYVLVLSGLVLLYTSLSRVPAFFTSQVGYLALAALVTLGSNFMYIVGSSPISALDWTPVSFIVSGAILGWGLLRGRILELAPVARTQVVEDMSDGVIVLDYKNHILDINPAARDYMTEGQAKLIGMPAAQVLLVWPDTSAVERGDTISQGSIVPGKAGPRYIDLRVSPLLDSSGQQQGKIVLLRDMTESKRLEEELRRANMRFQSQLEEIDLLRAKLHEEAIRDSLTGAFNRRYMDETLSRELAQANRQNNLVSLVMIDVDFFKRFNDTHGHWVGDLLLCHLVDLVSRKTRAGDTVCRFGGDEVVVVMPQATSMDVLRRAEEWRAEFEASALIVEEQVLQATISLGVATYPAHAQTEVELLKAADQGLYRAKQSGRNQVAPCL